MEKKRVAILNIKKNEITVKIKKKSRVHFGMCLIIIMAFVLSFSFGSSEIKNIGFSMSQIYNPVSSLYNDNSDVIFTNGTITGEMLGFYVPIIANYEIDQSGTITFEISNSIMVKASEAGVIEDIGVTNNGIKYIKIKHSNNIYTLTENIDIIGVQRGEIVKRGQDIATASQGAKVYFQIYKDNKKIPNIKIESTKIVWEN